MKGLKHTIEGYKKRGLGSEKIMNDSIDLLDEMIFMPMMNENESLYWMFMRELHELYCGEHFDEKFAMWEVSQMHHKGTDGTIYKGAKWGIEQTTPIFTKIKSQLTKPYNEWDWFVVLQMIWHDSCVLFHKWMPENNEEQFTQMYIDAAITWMNDEDYNGMKPWKYFEELHETD